MNDALGDQALAALDLLQHVVRLFQKQPGVVVVQVAAPVIGLQAVQHGGDAVVRVRGLGQFRDHVDVFVRALGPVHGLPAGQQVLLLLVEGDAEEAVQQRLVGAGRLQHGRQRRHALG